MKKAVLSLVFVFGWFAVYTPGGNAQNIRSAALQAQSATASAQQAVTLRARLSSGCPVDMRLNQSTNSRALETGRGQQGHAFAASLHLDLSNAPGSKAVPANVKTADVTVHGYDGTTRFELVSPGLASPGQEKLTVRRMEIRFVPQDGKGAAADFLVNGIVSARWLEVNSFTYANGTSWRPARGESCIVTLNPFELVGADSVAGKLSR
jgi:hypothetical protein